MIGWYDITEYDILFITMYHNIEKLRSLIEGLIEPVLTL